MRRLDRLNAVAMGDKKADLILDNCTLVNVYTQELLPEYDIAISEDRIAYVGPDASHASGPRTRHVRMGKMYAAPGLADAHTHIDQFVLPGELAMRSLLCGVTSLFSDPIDITGVAGRAGFDEFVRICSGLPIRIFNVVPGGLPVDPRFSHGRSLSTRQAKSAVKNPGVLGLGEVFSWTKVTQRDPKTMDDIAAMLEAGCVINGHTAGASEKKLNAYIASGILSCHEPINFDQVVDRVRLGMWIMIREGSIRRDIDSIVPQIIKQDIPTERLMFCSDGLDPHDLMHHGHIDHCIRKSVRLGMDPARAIAIASKNCFDYYSMGRDLGAVAPGRLADIIILDDLKSMKPVHVFVGGRHLVKNGDMAHAIRRPRIPGSLLDTVHAKRFSESDFAVRSGRRSVVANVIHLITEIVTKQTTVELPVRNGSVAACPEKGVYKVAAFDRTGRTSKCAVGFIENFGADIGAFASTWSFHENDLIVIGSNEADMALAANSLVRCGGGMTVTKNSRVAASMPLKFGGIVSVRPFDSVAQEFAGINNALLDAGFVFKSPHLVPLFLPFLALPSIRILCSGIIDVKRRMRLPAIQPGHA